MTDRDPDRSNDAVTRPRTLEEDAREDRDPLSTGVPGGDEAGGGVEPNPADLRKAPDLDTGPGFREQI